MYNKERYEELNNIKIGTLIACFDIALNCLRKAHAKDPDNPYINIDLEFLEKKDKTLKEIQAEINEMLGL